MDIPITLPDGSVVNGAHPLVILGPNGSGKTRQARNLTSTTQIDFVNALRNTRVAPELPAMGVDTARNQYTSQRNQARSQHWELTSEFDSMLSQMLAQDSMAAKEFTRRFRQDPSNPGQPEETPLTRVENLWGKVFPGRELVWQDWKPVVTNESSGQTLTYSGNQMSDGEKAALFLGGRVFSAEAGILVVDEPETHFHSLLAVRLWNELEDARPDLRFVYITHDLTFALSRRDAQYVLASPTDGLRVIDLGGDLPEDVAEALLGSASLSFYASRVVFCEGEETSLDTQIYNAWFDGQDTVVRPVSSCGMVLRCLDAVQNSGVAESLQAIGLIDGDYHADDFLDSLPSDAHALGVHEVESLLCLPDVVYAICEHSGQAFDAGVYVQQLIATVREQQRHEIVIDRWKARVRPSLTTIISQVNKAETSLDDLVANIPTIFDPQTWSFSPQLMLKEEKDRVESSLAGTEIKDFLRIVPGKQLLPVAAPAAGMTVVAYKSLIIAALTGGRSNLSGLSSALDTALSPYLPARHSDAGSQS